MRSLRRTYVGRRWASARIADWYASSEPVLVVTGGAGSGKTGLVYGVADGSLPAAGVPSAVRAVHRCNGHVVASIDPIRVVADIASQLARTVPGYAEALVRSHRWKQDSWGQDPSQWAKNAALDSVSAMIAYERTLRLPLRELARSRGRPPEAVVVVDGLDEGQQALPRLFAEILKSPAPGMRLLLTTRPGIALEPLRELPRLDLAADCPRGTDDIGEYLEALGGFTAADRSAIAATTAGSYPGAQLALRLADAGIDAAAIARRVPGLASSEHPGNAPQALLDQVLANVGGTDVPARQLLSVLARSRDSGMTPALMTGVLGASSDRVSTDLRHVRYLLTGGPCARPYHRCISERICALTPDLDVVDWMIGLELWRRWHEYGARCDPYTLRNLLMHLADVANVDRSGAADQALRDAATDLNHLTALLADAGVDDVVTALSYTLSRLHLPSNDLRIVADVFRHQAPQLRHATDWKTVATQLLYESAAMGASGIARRLAATVPSDGIVTMWTTSDSPPRIPSNPVQGHSGEVIELAVTSDATRAISASTDGTTRVWRLASGRVVHERAAPGHLVGLYSPTSAAPFVVAATADGSAQILDADTGDLVLRIDSHQSVKVTAFAVATDAACGISGHLDGHATVWNLAAGEPTLRLPSDVGTITSVAVTADGRAGAAASMHGDVKVWDLASGSPIARLRHPSMVNALALTPDASRLLVCGDDLVVYDLVSCATPPMARLVPNGWVTAAVVNPTMPNYALIGTAFGQVAYLRLPLTAGDRRNER